MKQPGGASGRVTECLYSDLDSAAKLRQTLSFMTAPAGNREAMKARPHAQHAGTMSSAQLSTTLRPGEEDGAVSRCNRSGRGSGGEARSRRSTFVCVCVCVCVCPPQSTARNRSTKNGGCLGKAAVICLVGDWIGTTTACLRGLHTHEVFGDKNTYTGRGKKTGARGDTWDTARVPVLAAAGVVLVGPEQVLVLVLDGIGGQKEHCREQQSRSRGALPRAAEPYYSHLRICTRRAERGRGTGRVRAGGRGRVGQGSVPGAAAERGTRGRCSSWCLSGVS